MKRSVFLSLLGLGLALSTTPAVAGLIIRGGGLVYDSAQNITWLQDTNLGGAGRTWVEALAWADSLVYQGYDDWRLPSSPATAQGFLNEGELGHLYSTTLGNVAGGPLANTGPFVGFPSPAVFWLDAPPIHAGSAWNFEFYRGMQNASSDTNSWYAWAVRDGDSHPTAVPEIATGGLGSSIALIASFCALLRRHATPRRNAPGPRRGSMGR